MRHLALLVTLLAAAPAHAACKADLEVFSCKIGKKTVEVCYWKDNLTYSYGTASKTEMFLTNGIFTPWPGIGSSIWQSVAFSNKGYTYEVWSSVERNPATTKGVQAGVNVLKGGNLQAQLNCTPGTLRENFDLIPY
ncbi:hypothetical protein [Tabrizicola sp.]|uniref:hypothetical protein n=1 Tax=Tabrizicola sp. TaxID=2005166 RepID=UPI003F37A208